MDALFHLCLPTFYFYDVIIELCVAEAIKYLHVDESFIYRLKRSPCVDLKIHYISIKLKELNYGHDVD